MLGVYAYQPHPANRGKSLKLLLARTSQACGLVGSSFIDYDPLFQGWIEDRTGLAPEL